MIKRSYSWNDMFNAMFAGWMSGVAFICFITVATAQCGCSTANPKAKMASPLGALAGVVPVSIVAWPSPIRPECELFDLPAVPQIITYTNPADLGIDRIYVTNRQVADILVWLHDVKTWGDAMHKCMGKLLAP